MVVSVILLYDASSISVSHNDSLISLFPKGALTGTTLFPNAAPPATSASKSDSLPVAAAGESESIDDLKVAVSNDDDANAEDGAKDEDGGEYQCDVASACAKLSGIDLAELTPSQASEYIPTIWRVLQDSGDDNQRQIALGALKQVLSIGRKNEGVAYADLVEEIFRVHRGVLNIIFLQLKDFQRDTFPTEVRDLAESILSTFRSDTAENEGTTESKDEVEGKTIVLALEFLNCPGSFYLRLSYLIFAWCLRFTNLHFSLNFLQMNLPLWPTSMMMSASSLQLQKE